MKCRCTSSRSNVVAGYAACLASDAPIGEVRVRQVAFAADGWRALDRVPAPRREVSDNAP